MDGKVYEAPVKMLVTHQNPDMDAIGACWLLKRFLEEDFHEAEYYFVPAGDEVLDAVLTAKGYKREEVVHVDTGLGIFDHHQPGHTRRDSASLLVYEYLCQRYPDLENDEALGRVVDFLNETDHFGSYWWPEANNDRYMFGLEEVLSGLRSGKQFTDRELVEFGMVCLDGAFTSMKIKVSAEEDVKALGQEFETKWGKALAIENSNDAVMKLAQRMGYEIVVRKDKEMGNIRIKAAPKDEIMLDTVFEEIKERDQEGTWYYHPSGHMLINGSKKHVGQKPSPLSLVEVVEIIKNS